MRLLAHTDAHVFHHLPSIPQKVQVTLEASRILQWMGKKKDWGKRNIKKKDRYRGQAILGLKTAKKSS